MAIDLPDAISSNEIEKDRIVVAITKEGQISLDSKPVESGKLLSSIKSLNPSKRKKILEIQADKIIEFKRFSKIIRAAQEAGYQDFIFATEIQRK